MIILRAMRTRGRLRQKGSILVMGVATMVFLGHVLGPRVLAAGTVVPWDDDPIHDYWHLLFADVVVQGTVTEVTSDLIPVRKTRPDLGPEFDDHYVKAIIVTITVGDFLKGFNQPESLAFSVVAPTEAPVLKQVGLEIIVGLKASGCAPDATFEMKSREGLYVYDGEFWVSQGQVKGGRKHTAAELRAKLNSVSIQRLSESADAVFLGTVDRIEESKYWGSTTKIYGLIKKVTLHVDERIIGDIAENVTVSAVIAGSYWPKWRYEMPRGIKVGDRYYAFVKETDGVLHVVGGVNGFFRLEGDRMLYDNRIELPHRLDDLNTSVRRYAREGE